MSAIMSEINSVENCPSNLVDGREPQECTKNGLVNGLVHKNMPKMNKPNKDALETDEENIQDGKEWQDGMNIEQNHMKPMKVDVSNIVKSKRKTKKKKAQGPLDSNDNLNESKTEETSHQINDSEQTESCIDPNMIETEVEKSPSCSKTSISSSDIICDTISSDLEKLVIKDDNNLDKTPNSERKEECHKKVDFVRYESELQMPMIMKIIQKDLSEPYSIYTYRYFIHNWPKLCFLAMCEGQCVGAIVCKLDLHRKVVRRGYIAMLAVDQNYRKLRIGSTLVQMAIHEMTNGDADEVVLETEVTNKPALKLYEKLGFVRDKRLFRYYLNGVDALRLKLWLR